VTPPPRSRAEIEALLDAHFPNLDPETRAAFIAWGGPLDIRKGKDMPRFACQRPTPRQHPNEHLTAVMEEVQDFYNSTGQKERETAFGRALGIVRAWPRRITSSADIKGAPHIGEVRACMCACVYHLCVYRRLLTSPSLPTHPRVEHAGRSGADPEPGHVGPAGGAAERPAQYGPSGPDSHPPGR
jgi:hypothetical protein